jgi:hypothetical protein
VPPAGYLWTQVRSAGISVRAYGLFNPSLPPDKTTDAERIKSFLDDLSQYEKSGDMPRLTILHAAIDDRNLGALVEACSRSRFWPTMAVFIANTATTGADPVSPYRAPAFVLSPYTRRAGTTDSNFYNSASMLRTIELVLGLRPMTWFDASAPPMWNAFSPAPNPAPFTPALH